MLLTTNIMRPSSHEADAMHIQSNQPVSESRACQLNHAVLRKLQKAFEADPEVDLASKIPLSYSTRLADRRAEGHHETLPKKCRMEDATRSPRDVRDQLHGNFSATVLFPLSESTKSLILSDPEHSDLTHGVRRLVQHSEVIWMPPFGTFSIVLKCSPTVALKIVLNLDNFTEYTTLQYLEIHKPNIPAPRPLGLIRLGKCILIFMSLMPGTTLGAVWQELDDSLKRSVQQQLNDIFVELRSMNRPEDSPLGGVSGEGCQDLRRHVRHTKTPIWTTKDFDDWQFSNPHFGSLIYIEALRRLSPPFSERHVLSHNDLRPDNITVKFEDGQCRVTGIIDWQFAGFYPEYYESTKVMNGLSTNESSDWYLFIPECISPIHDPQKWLLDALWWKHVE